MRIWLIGMMGSGKTTVGRLCATLMGFEFADTDEMVEANAASSIGDIWASSGEAGFRKLEEEAISRLGGSIDVVVATGGGSVLSAANTVTMAKESVVVWLRAGADLLGSRVATGHRPLISADVSVVDQLSHLIDQREALYSGLADHIVDVEGRSVEEVAGEVVRLCRR